MYIYIYYVCERVCACRLSLLFDSSLAWMHRLVPNLCRACQRCADDHVTELGFLWCLPYVAVSDSRSNMDKIYIVMDYVEHDLKGVCVGVSCHCSDVVSCQRRAHQMGCCSRFSASSSARQLNPTRNYIRERPCSFRIRVMMSTNTITCGGQA